MQATQTIPAASAPLQFPKAQPAVQTVTQAELVELIEHENLLSQLKEKVSELESGIKSRLEGGAAVQPGVHIASLKENLRRNVAWKDVVLRLAEKLGYEPEAYVSNVLVHTKPTRTISLEVH